MKGPLDNPPAEEVTIEKDTTANETPVPSEDEMLRTHLGRAIGLDNFKDIGKNSHQLDRLIEWARMKGSSERQDIVWQIRQLANRIGGPSMGNNWAQHLSTYAYLEMERMKLDKQLKEMEPKV